MACAGWLQLPHCPASWYRGMGCLARSMWNMKKHVITIQCLVAEPPITQDIMENGWSQAQGRSVSTEHGANANGTSWPPMRMISGIFCCERKPQFFSDLLVSNKCVSGSQPAYFSSKKNGAQVEQRHFPKGLCWGLGIFRHALPKRMPITHTKPNPYHIQHNYSG